MAQDIIETVIFKRQIFNSAFVKIDVRAKNFAFLTSFGGWLELVTVASVRAAVRVATPVRQTMSSTLSAAVAMAMRTNSRAAKPINFLLMQSFTRLFCPLF